MSKHTAKHHRNAVKTGHAAHPLKRAHARKRAGVKRTTSQQKKTLSKATVARQGAEPETVELAFVNLRGLGEEPDAVAEVVEVYEVRTASGTEDEEESEGPGFALEDTD